MSATLKVLHLLHDSRRSGVPAVASRIILNLDPARVDSTVLFAYEGIYAAELREAGFSVRTVGKRLPLFWRLNRFLLNFQLIKLLPETDIVHVHSIKLAASVIIAKWLGARVVFHLHERPGRIGRVLTRAVGLADCVVFCAKNCAAHFSGVPAQRKRLILNAISLPEPTPAPVPGGRKKIVMLGSINRNKGQELLLRAFAGLDRDDAELWFYGTVGLSARGYVDGLKRFVRDHDLADRVFFPGPTADADGVYRDAALLVHASLQECLSISVMEALSHGVPVIANDIIGMDEIVTDGVNGYLVKTGNIAMLTGRMARLLDDPGLCRRMGAAGRATVRERFNIASRITEYLALYEELAAGKERGARG